MEFLGIKEFQKNINFLQVFALGSRIDISLGITKQLV